MLEYLYGTGLFLLTGERLMLRQFTTTVLNIEEVWIEDNEVQSLKLLPHQLHLLQHNYGEYFERCPKRFFLRIDDGCVSVKNYQCRLQSLTDRVIAVTGFEGKLQILTEAGEHYILQHKYYAMRTSIFQPVRSRVPLPLSQWFVDSKYKD